MLLPISILIGPHVLYCLNPIASTFSISENSIHVTSLPHIKVLFFQFSRHDTSLLLVILSLSPPHSNFPARRQLWWKQGKSRRPQRREKRRILMNLKNQFQHMLYSFVTHRLPSRDRIPMPLLGRFQKLWLPCGTVLERSKNR